MVKTKIPDGVIADIDSFLKKNRKADVITTYLFFLEKKFNLHPVVFIREKKIYQSESELIRILENESRLWRETDIKIQVGKSGVNEETKKIYICPHSGKVFGDNTCLSPQDAIYDWVSACPENTERQGGLRVKRFYISEDPEIIKNYIKKQKAPLNKKVYTSIITGKLFDSKRGVIADLIKNHVRTIPMQDVPTQNKFEIQEDFLSFIQEYLDEAKISDFISSLSEHEIFAKNIARWEEEGSDER